MYFIIENQIRPDGQVNSITVSRDTFASALSYYHERFSKMLMTDMFVSVSIMLVDANLNQLQKDTIKTLYAETPTE